MKLRPAFTTLALSLVITCALTGCVTVKRSFPGHSPEQVWTAMVAVAERPQYPDWHVLENHVWSDEASHRIEIDRILHRNLVRPESHDVYEKWEWKLSVTLDPADPPTLKFVSRGWAVPMHAQKQGFRFADDVEAILSGKLGPTPEAPAAGPSSPTAKPGH